MKKSELLFEKWSPFINRISSNATLKAISASMIGLFPVSILGSLSLLLYTLMATLSISNPNVSSILMKVYNLTIGLMAIYVSVLISKNIAKARGYEKDVINISIVSLLSFLILTPIEITETGVKLPLDWLGAKGIFTALLTGYIVARIYCMVAKKGWTIKLPNSVPPNISSVFESVIPGLIICIFFMIVSGLFSLSEMGSIHTFIYSLIQQPLQSLGGTLPALIVLSIMSQVLWFFGIHGTSIILPILTTVYRALDAENMAAIAAGTEPTNIIGLAFFNTITFGGCLLGITALAAFTAKSKQFKQIGRLSLVPAIFGINEPFLFGTPIVLNFYFLVPFILVPNIIIILSYFLTVINILPVFPGIAPIFGLPIGLHASMQGQWILIVWQLVVNVIAAILYYPFFRVADKKAYMEEQQIEMNK